MFPGLVTRKGTPLSQISAIHNIWLYLVLLRAESQRGTMVLVHGIHKKTQKTPAVVIVLARKRMKEGT